MKTKVFFDEFKGQKLFAIWEVDEADNKVGQYPILSFGYKKAQALMTQIESLKDFVSCCEQDLTRKKGVTR